MNHIPYSKIKVGELFEYQFSKRHKSNIYLKTLVFGSMIKGDAPEHIWNFFEISEKNKFKEVGYPKVATKSEVESFNS